DPPATADPGTPHRVQRIRGTPHAGRCRRRDLPGVPAGSAPRWRRPGDDLRRAPGSDRPVRASRHRMWTGMIDEPVGVPTTVLAAQNCSGEVGFALSCENRTGALLRTLAASKPGGRILELGTGTGVGTAWLLAGMDPTARLTSVEIDWTTQAVPAACSA